MRNDCRRRRRPPCPWSRCADVLLRREPDEDEDDEDEGDGKEEDEEDDDSESTDDGYSE